MSKGKKEVDIDEESVFEELEGGEELLVSKKLKGLKKKLSECEGERKEYLQGWQRAQADIINTRKTLERDLSGRVERSKAQTFLDLLPVLDSFEAATERSEAWGKVDKEWRVGMEYIYNQLQSVFQEHGIVSFSPLGEVFDPTLHNSVGMLEVGSRKETNKIVEVLQKGYLHNKNLLRPASVKVGEYKKT